MGRWASHPFPQKTRKWMGHGALWDVSEFWEAWPGGWRYKRVWAVQTAEKGCISPKILKYVPRWLKPTLI